MTGTDYQRAAMRTANVECKLLSNCGLGLTGEAGEVADEIKKFLFHGHPLNTEKVVKELGDVMWYIALTCDVLHLSLDDVMRLNVEKLLKRYPDGFDSDKSLHRMEGDV